MRVDIRTCELGMLATNCYIVGGGERLLIIDPGDCPPGFIEAVEADGRTPEAILLTHGHYDHFLGVDSIAGHFHLPVYALDKEKPALENSQINLSKMFSGKDEALTTPITYFSEGDILELAGMKIRTIWVPGHSPGGCCYYISEENVLFSGDCLFCGSIGRTDFPQGDYEALISTLKNKILILPDDTQVFPGHGPGTTIGYERVSNPYLAR